MVRTHPSRCGRSASCLAVATSALGSTRRLPAAAVQHNAHTLRTPKHEGLYRYAPAAAFQHNARTHSGPPSTGATITMDGGVAPLLLLNTTPRAARARARTSPDPQAREPLSLWTEVWPTQPVLTLDVLTPAVNRRSLGEERAPGWQPCQTIAPPPPTVYPLPVCVLAAAPDGFGSRLPQQSPSTLTPHPSFPPSTVGSRASRVNWLLQNV